MHSGTVTAPRNRAAAFLGGQRGEEAVWLVAATAAWAISFPGHDLREQFVRGIVSYSFDC